jgi:toxin-antitoxin system PIN domain toxin
MSDLLDVNVWVALVDKRHVHHGLARDYWIQHGTAQFAFCRITMLGFLRVITSPQAVANPKTQAEAWTIYQQFQALPNVQFLSEPTGLDAQFQPLTTQAGFPHRLWTDAYLAAFAHAGACRVVSFDADFARFPSVDFLHLAP